MSNLTRTEANQKIYELIKGIRIAMLTTQTDGGKLLSRPMATQEAEFDGTIYFLSGWDTEKIEELQRHPEVNVAFSNPGKNTYVSVSGVAKVYRDQATIDRLWSAFDKAWFPKGKEDPNIAVIEIDAHSAEYWDSPSSTVVQLYGMVKATLTGTPPKGGENERVNL